MFVFPLARFRHRSVSGCLAGWFLPATLALPLACGGGGAGGTQDSPAPPRITYPVPTITAIAGLPLAPQVPAVTGPVTQFTISPALPTGLGLNPTNGAISGTPAAAAPPTTYSVEAANAEGSSAASLVLSVSANRPRLLQCSEAVPTTAAVVRDLANLALSPYDGLILALMAGRVALSTTPYNTGLLADDAVNLPKINSTQLTDNFLLVRGGADAGFDRFSDADWVQALANLTTTAQYARLGHLKGLAFDPEAYASEGQTSLFDYRTYDSSTHTFAQCQANLRLRGQQIMTAIQEAYPDSTVFLLSGLGALRSGTTADYPAADFPAMEYGLMPDFLNGMLDVLAPGMVIVDGNETSYPFYNGAFYSNLKTLELGADAQTLVSPANLFKYQSQVQAGMADYLDATFNLYHSPDYLAYYLPSADYPAFFQYQLYYGLTSAVQYLWVYSETTDWLARTNIPAGAEAAMLNAKAEVSGGQPLGVDIQGALQDAATSSGMGW